MDGVLGGTHVLVLAKEPVPGRVKTRLCPPYSPEQAARICEAALADTLEAVAACGADRRILALDGSPGAWLPAGFEVIAQRGVTFGERLAHAWADAGGAGIQIGMDTPQVRPDDLDRLLSRVAPGRALLGPTDDGGWWVLGLARPCNGAFVGVPMSTASTFARQRSRLEQLGLLVDEAPRLRDIDTATDLVAVAAAMPSTRTAAAVA